MKISSAGLSIIKEFEGFRANAYRDPVGIWTIGFGTIRGVKPGDVVTRSEAERRLRHELVEYERAVERATGGNATQPQFDALVSFAYNVGVKGMAGSTVIKRHNAGDHQAAARAFGLWNKAGGKVWPGLTRRRAAEAALYAEPVMRSIADEPAPMPQAIDPERPMTASTINRASVAAGTTATLAAAGEALQTVQGVRYGLQGLEDWIVPALLVVVVALCGYIVWERANQRKEGWA